MYGDTVTRYYYTQSSFKLRTFQKNNYQTTEMEQQMLRAVNHIKYVSKKGVTISSIQRFLKKISTTTFDETCVGEIICEMQQNGKIDGKFKIINPIYADKNFAEDPLEIHSKTYNNKLAIINLLFQQNQLILSLLTLIMMIIAQPIKILPVNILTLMIQIKLHLIAKLL